MVIKVFLTVVAVWVTQGVFEFFTGEWWQLSLSIFSAITLLIAYLIYSKIGAE